MHLYGSPLPEKKGRSIILLLLCVVLLVLQTPEACAARCCRGHWCPAVPPRHVSPNCHPAARVQ